MEIIETDGYVHGLMVIAGRLIVCSLTYAFFLESTLFSVVIN